MKLLVYRQLWGLPVRDYDTRTDNNNSNSCNKYDAIPAEFTDWSRICHDLHHSGYSGIEASLMDVGGRLIPSSSESHTPLLDRDASVQGMRSFQSAVSRHGLQWTCGIYSGWRDYSNNRPLVHPHEDSIDAHLECLARDIEVCRVVGVTRANAHAGSDQWHLEDTYQFFRRALMLHDATLPAKVFTKNVTSLLVSYETHRGRPLGSPVMASELLNRLPELTLTLDFSHWVIVSERLLDWPLEEQWLSSQILPRVRHLHARVGSPQQPQLSLPSTKFGTDQLCWSRFERLWKQLWTLQLTRGDAFTSATCEYGPVPYTPVNCEQGMEQPIYDVNDLCTHAKDRLCRLFSNV